MFVETMVPADDQNNQQMEFDESKFPKFSEIDPNNATPDQVAELVKASQTLLGQAKHWHTKAKNPPAPKNSEPNKPNSQQQQDPDVIGQMQSKLETLSAAEEKRQFGYQHKLSPEETDHAFAFAKGLGKKPHEVLDNTFFKSGLQALRQQQRASGAIPGPSNRSFQVEGKTFNELKPEDKKKNFASYVASKSKR